MKSRTQLAKNIYDVSNLKGQFRLRSGAVSDTYFDKYLFEADPELLEKIALEMRELVPPEAEVLAGLELGGIPLVTMLSRVIGLPALFVRKKAKEYGTCKLAEGGRVDGRNMVIVEDVVTSGGQILLSARELRVLGARILCVLCVIDRESGGVENLAKENLELRALFKMSDFVP